VTEAVEREVFFSVISFDILVAIGVCVEIFLFLLLDAQRVRLAGEPGA